MSGQRDSGFVLHKWCPRPNEGEGDTCGELDSGFIAHVFANHEPRITLHAFGHYVSYKHLLSKLKISYKKGASHIVLYNTRSPYPSLWVSRCQSLYYLAKIPAHRDDEAFFLLEFNKNRCEYRVFDKSNLL